MYKRQALPAQFEQTTQMVRAPHERNADELAVSVLLSPGYHSSRPSDDSYLAAGKTLAKSPRLSASPVAVRALWQPV